MSTCASQLSCCLLVGWLSTWSVFSKQWDVIVGTFSGYRLRWWLLPDQHDNWKFLAFLIRWWIKARWKGHGLNKSSNGLYTHHDRLVMQCLVQEMFILLLTKCHIMIDHQNRQRLLVTMWNVSGGNGCILLVCKALSSNCDVYNCSKPILQDSSPCIPWC